MLPSAGRQYAGIREEALGQAAKKVGGAVGSRVGQAVEKDLVTNKYTQHRANAESKLAEKKGFQELEQKGASEKREGEEEFMFRNQPAPKPPQPRRVTSKSPKSGSSVSKSQTRRASSPAAAPTTGANS